MAASHGTVEKDRDRLIDSLLSRGESAISAAPSVRSITMDPNGGVAAVAAALSKLALMLKRGATPII